MKNISKLNFRNFFLESDNFLLNKISGQRDNVGVNYVTSISASVEAYREVGGHLEETPIVLLIV